MGFLHAVKLLALFAVVWITMALVMLPILTQFVAGKHQARLSGVQNATKSLDRQITDTQILLRQIKKRLYPVSVVTRNGYSLADGLTLVRE